jgi:gamma-glutamyltranspeptidase/glutathione hydrolase
MIATCRPASSAPARATAPIAAILTFLAAALLTLAPATGQESPLRAWERGQAAERGGDRITGENFASRSPVIAQHGMAATAHPLATQVALDILKAGGSAVDAAIAANAALGLMEPVGNGIGGDLYAIIWDPQSERLYGLNASGRSPKGMTLEDIRQHIGEGAELLPPFGAIPVTVPGAVDGWFEMHERFGRLGMDKVLAPAIRYAREGHPLTQLIAFYWERNMHILEARFDDNPLNEIDNARATYYVNGRAPREGEIFRNPDLARTYEMLAREGRDAFYKGEIARTIDAYMKRIGGYLRYEDMAAHESEWVEPATVNYRGYDIYQLPPNTQGVAALQMLKILEGFDLAGMGFGSAESIHVQVEAKRLAFEDRARFYVDTDFYDVPLEWLLSDEYADERRALISMDRAMDGPLEHGAAPINQGDTTYLVTADKDGMMVSLIQSNYRGMGSGLVPDGLGFMLQDRGQLFHLDPDHPNGYAPGKRPFHTIIPGFAMKDGEPWLAFGVMGGGMQPQGHVQILVNMIDYGMNVQEAGDAARWQHYGSTEPTGEAQRDRGRVHLESGISDETRAGLEARGHTLGGPDGGFGGYQAIMWDRENGVYHGASEMRKDGAAQGY